MKFIWKVEIVSKLGVNETENRKEIKPRIYIYIYRKSGLNWKIMWTEGNIRPLMRSKRKFKDRNKNRGIWEGINGLVKE